MKNGYLVFNKVTPFFPNTSIQELCLISIYFYTGQLKLSSSGAKRVVLRGHRIHQLMLLPSVLKELSPSSF
jgi:hypothetical protein